MDESAGVGPRGNFHSGANSHVQALLMNLHQLLGPFDDMGRADCRVELVDFECGREKDVFVGHHFG